MSGQPQLSIWFARNLFLPEDLGGNRYPLETIRRLGERGHPVTVLTPRLHGHYPALAGVRYRHYPISRRHPLLTHATNVLGSAVTATAERARPPDVLLAGSYDAALGLSLAGLTARAPLVFLFHSEFYSEWVQALGHGPRAMARRAVLGYMRAVERRVIRASRRIVAVSQFSARQIRAADESAAGCLRVVTTGVDTRYFEPGPGKDVSKQELGRDPRRRLILGVGRLVGVKQLDRLVAGFARARADGVDADLVIAGDGPERSRLQRQIQELGLEGQATLAGFCDPPRLRALQRAADLQVCSSAFENFSLAILEGFACGTPVLGTPGGGTPELVGLLGSDFVLPGDASEAISAGLRRVLCEPGKLIQAGARARALAVERFDWERVVDRLEDVCQEACAEAGAITRE